MCVLVVKWLLTCVPSPGRTGLSGDVGGSSGRGRARSTGNWGARPDTARAPAPPATSPPGRGGGAGRGAGWGL